MKKVIFYILSLVIMMCSTSFALVSNDISIHYKSIYSDDLTIRYVSIYRNILVNPEDHFSATEIRILNEVAKEYKLNQERIRLLFAIRKVENGGPGLEMGVGDGIPDHPARRFADDFESSLRCQAQWAAGTIVKRYHGDLRSFARRYCERANHWLTMTSRWIRKLSNVS